MITNALTAETWLVLLAILLSTILLIWGPPHLQWRRGSSRRTPWFLGKTVYAPVFAVVMLGVAQAVYRSTGGAGDPGELFFSIYHVLIDKYDIVLLIMSFAYLSISLDRSGFFEYCSLLIVRRAGGDGIKLLVFLYLLCSVLTFFTSNDIVIISITPIILYVGKNARIQNLIPLLISQFMAANTLSMGLYIGSPTNIVLGDATGMTFIDFARWMIGPAVVACLVTLVMLLILFRWVPLRRNRMQATYIIPGRAYTVTASSDMWVKVVIFAISLCLLTASSYLNIELWSICLVTAVTLFAYDLIILRIKKESFHSFLSETNRRMPWPIAPFVVSYFTMVYALSATGFIDRTGQAILNLAEGSSVKLSLLFGFISAALVNVMNDIPSTVFWADMVPFLRANLDPQQFDIVILSTIVGVNPGCYLTLIGALAGLMWMSILRKWSIGSGMKMPTGKDLSFYGFLVIGPVLLLTCLFVVLTVSLFS
jgi:arsenical pump membrane protein